MKKIFALAALAIISWNSQAQTKTGKITGTVIDGSSKIIESATISLLRAQDSVVVKFTVADKTGRYEFDNIPAGKYIVSVSSVGHNKGYSEVAEINDKQTSLSLKTLELVPQAKSMGAVTVVSKKPFIEQKIDRTVINVEASVTNAGSTALDVLEKSPGVTVDKDGNISLKGKQGVTVMMDGRPTYLSATELANYLRNLPASSLDQIEIMTNPSAKYDAAGNSGIINIKVKKNKQAGFNGSLALNYGQGRYWKSNNSLNLNYRTGKVNLFANGGVSQWNGFQTLTIHREFKNGGSGSIESILDQVNNMRNSNTYSNLKIGADFYASKKTTLGVVASGFTNPGKFSSRSFIYLQDDKSKVDSINYTDSRNKNKWKNGSLNLNMRHQFDSTGRELTADLDYVTYGSDNTQTLGSTSYDPDWVKKGIKSLRGDLPVSIDIYSAKIDYMQPLKNGAKLEMGLKSSYVETANEANYFNGTSSGEAIDYDKTNHFDYKENINAAYVNFNRQFKKWGVQTGLRFEQISYEGFQHGNSKRQDSSFKRNYANLFPTVFLSYKANDNNQFAASFGRRIDRPAYQNLNPFLFFLDEYTYEAGNTFLKPQYTNNFEVSHTFKSFLTTTINYSITKDMMAETFEQAENVNGTSGLATIVRRGNIGKRNAAGASVSAQIKVTKWWTSILYSNLNYNKFSGTINGNEKIDIDATNLTANINNQFNFDKGWSAELSGWYRTKGVEGQILIQPMGAASAGVSKQIMKQKGSVKLTVRDLFYTQYPKGNMSFQNTIAYFENRRDSRVMNLSFSYRFGKPIKDQRQRRKIGGADEEQNRVKVGGDN